MIKYESQEESEDLGFITIFLGLAAKLDIDLSSVILYFSVSDYWHYDIDVTYLTDSKQFFSYFFFFTGNNKF